VEYKHELAITAYTNQLTQFMDQQGMSQSELARRLGVSRARVSQLMQHASSPTLRTMVEVANALGCDVNPGLAPCGFRPARLYVADGGRTLASYSTTRQLSDAIGQRPIVTERIAV
jgi:transcriptional regulator with XRE-family HTH domain